MFKILRSDDYFLRLIVGLFNKKNGNMDSKDGHQIVILFWHRSLYTFALYF